MPSSWSVSPWSAHLWQEHVQADDVYGQSALDCVACRGLPAARRLAVIGEERLGVGARRSASSRRAGGELIECLLDAPIAYGMRRVSGATGSAQGLALGVVDGRLRWCRTRPGPMLLDELGVAWPGALGY